jgi:hypothetical protein
MQSNKQKWAERHEQGLTRLDVATGVQKEADAARIQETIEKANKKSKRQTVNAVAEAIETGKVKKASKKVISEDAEIVV